MQLPGWIPLASALLAITAVFGGCAKEDPATAADAFFAMLREGKTQDAYAATAFGFQAQQSPASFEATVKDQGLRGFQSLTWTRKEAAKDSHIQIGEMVNAAGQKVQVRIEMVRDGSHWKLYSLQVSDTADGVPKNPFSLSGKSTGFASIANLPMPSEAEIISLVRESLLKFNEALGTKSFQSFYDSVSVLWQSQLTEQRLQNAFAPFIEKNVSIDAIRDLEPVLNERPRITEEGLLVVSGEYPTQPNRVRFSMKYVYELPDWKLFGINLEIVPQPNPSLR